MPAKKSADVGVENVNQDPARVKRNPIRSHQQLIGMIILSVAFIIGSLSVASGIRARNQTQKNQITITGSAEEAVTSNLFQWTATFASTQSTTSAALAQLNGWTVQIRKALLGAGALNSEVSFGTVNVQPNYQASGAVTSFTMSQTVTVQSSRLAAMQRVLGVSTSPARRQRPVHRATTAVHVQRTEETATRSDGGGGRERSNARPSRSRQERQVGNADFDLGGTGLGGRARVRQLR